jgi:hypothetical protein
VLGLISVEENKSAREILGLVEERSFAKLLPDLGVLACEGTDAMVVVECGQQVASFERHRRSALDGLRYDPPVIFYGAAPLGCQSHGLFVETLGKAPASRGLALSDETVTLFG